MMGGNDYDATRRTKREHKRVTRQGTELFEADHLSLDGRTDSEAEVRAQDVDVDFSDDAIDGGTADDYAQDGSTDDNDTADEQRILAELPPHWAQFNERD